MDRYRVFSTTDLANWTDEGEILRADDVPWGRPEGGFMWAPDCVYRDGLYYFYFPHPVGDEWNNSWTVGVAVSDSPIGGFRDNEIVRLRLADGTPIQGGGIYIDPMIFIDDDGSYYLAIGGSSEFRFARLADNMTELAEEFTVYRNNAIRFFHEGPWMFHRTNDHGEKLYYLMYPGGVEGTSGDSMHYSVSGSPYGPWEYGGIILEPVPYSYTSHGSVVEFQGQWYIFYHNAVISQVGEIRSVCAEPLFFNEYGDILPVTQSETGLRTLRDPNSPDFGEMRILIEPRDGKEEPIVFFDVEGPGGGPVRANIRVHHRSQRINNRINIFLNGEDLSFINTLAGREYTDVTLLLAPGVNRLILSAGQGGPRVQHITIRFLE
jgi:hypothetical protein